MQFDCLKKLIILYCTEIGIMSNSSDLLDKMIPILEKHCNRANLKEGVSYTKCQRVNGKMKYTDVGRFVRSYCMGSGDGMTLHWEFNIDGKVYTESDDMWGSIDGEELMYYKETPDVVVPSKF